jgi:thiosulfate dehydrogenase [quinone] large subunit
VDKFELQGSYAWDNYVTGSARIAGGIASSSFLPLWATQPYALALPWLLGLTGALVLLGVKTGWSVLASGLVYVSLAFGLMAAQESEGVAWLAIHVALCAFALTLVARERLALWPHRRTP